MSTLHGSACTVLLSEVKLPISSLGVASGRRRSRSPCRRACKQAVIEISQDLGTAAHTGLEPPPLPALAASTRPLAHVPPPFGTTADSFSWQFTPPPTQWLHVERTQAVAQRAVESGSVEATMATTGVSLAITVGIYAAILIAALLLFSKCACWLSGWQLAGPRRQAGGRGGRLGAYVPCVCRATHLPPAPPSHTSAPYPPHHTPHTLP